MALSASVLRSTRGLSSMRPQIKVATTVYPGGYTALGNSSAATDVPGRIYPWTGAAGETPLGYVSEQVQVIGTNTDGNTGSASTSVSPMQRCSVGVDGGVIDNVAVTGLAGTVADMLKYVYQTADDTRTLTRPAAPNRTPVGIVVEYKTSSVADVYFFSFIEMLQLAQSGSNVRTICLGAIGAETPSAQNLLTGIVMSGHGKIIDTYAICVNASTDADWTQLVNLEIGAVDVTGGVITTATADAQGDKKAGTAITAANEFHDGDLLDVEAATVTAGTANNGLYNLYITVEYLPGL